MNKCVIDYINSLGSFKLELNFHDGKVHTIDFSEVELEQWQKALENLEYFNQVSIDESGYLEWPNGEDFPAEHLYLWEEYKDTYKKR
ncbi:MAG: DUF2442 domain-containing protein [Candidatus Algichlamydia australiensis]|nr:DUF2442 domain-containing protein [Chlamydiales bacterium]